MKTFSSLCLLIALMQLPNASIQEKDGVHYTSYIDIPSNDLLSVLREITAWPNVEIDSMDACSLDNQDISLIKIHAVFGTNDKEGLMLIGLPKYLCHGENRVAIAITSDGGKNWSIPAWVEGGFSEAFFFSPMDGWIITQWVIEGTFPTLYRIKGHKIYAVRSDTQLMLCPFTYAWNLNFLNNKEGMIQISCEDGTGTDSPESAGIKVMKTINSGRTWGEVQEKYIPSWYTLMEFSSASAGMIHARFVNHWFIQRWDTQRILYQTGTKPAQLLQEW